MSEELRENLRRVIEAGYQLSADGFEYMSGLDAGSLRKVVDDAIHTANISRADINILDQQFLESIQEKAQQETTTEDIQISPMRPSVRPIAADYDAQITILDDRSFESSGDLEGFIEYFRSRFKKISGILRKRIDMRDVVTIGSTLRMPLKSKAKVIGIVTRKRPSSSRLFLDIEDDEDAITVLASDQETVRKGLSILVDQVICVDAVKYKQDLLIANDFIWPDIPMQPPRRSEEPVCAALLADVHVGSVHFREDLFIRFISWLRGGIGNSRHRKLASRVKYLVIAGDLVDGIGIYPNQLDELEIPSIREQYEKAARMLAEVPDHVEIIILPGNHDAVRNSLPQPPIGREYAENLHDDARTRFLVNPCRLQLNGVEVYISHGKALDEILSQVPGMDFQHPIRGMELLLRCRHVAPTYGSSTPIAPAREDRLVIESPPDIFQMGHIHVHGRKKYKGTTLISSGSWQEQTPFQKRVNLVPSVGIAPIVDLQTHRVEELDFKSEDLVLSL